MKRHKVSIFVILLFCGILTSFCTACNQPVDKGEDSSSVPFEDSHSVQPSESAPKDPPQAWDDLDYSSYESTSLEIMLEFPREWAELIVLSDGMSWDGFIKNQLDPIECVLISVRPDLFNGLPNAADADEYETVLAYVYWRQPNTSGPEADMGDEIVLAEREDGSECVCFMPLTTKMGYMGDDATMEEIWDAFVTVETGILNGKCRIGSPPQPQTA